MERVKLEIGTWGGLIDNTEYGADVTVTASMPEDGAERLQDRLTELSAGGIILQVLGENYRPGLREEVDGAR